MLRALEAGRFVADWARVATREIDCTQLKMLIEGIEPRRCAKRYRHAGEAAMRITPVAPHGASAIA